MKTNMKPIVSWGLWAVGLSVVMGVITREHLIAGFEKDNTGMSYVIVVLFAAGLVVSLLSALKLQSEWSVLSDIKSSNTIPDSDKEGDIAGVFKKLQQYKTEGEMVNPNAAIDTYHSKHNSSVRSVSIMAALVISMGLLGTVVGLIISISGLGDMVDSIGSARTAMMDSLSKTVAGMGTAFYTTFFGALSGLILRAVAVSQLNSLTELCAEAAEYADVHLTTSLESQEDELNKKVADVVESFGKMKEELDEITSGLGASFETALKKFSESLTEAGDHAVETTKEAISGISSQLFAYSTEIGKTFTSFDESVKKAGEELGNTIGKAGETITESVGSVSQCIGASGEELTEAFTGLNGMIGKAGESVQEAIGTVNDEIEKSGKDLTESFLGMNEAISNTGEEVRESLGKTGEEVRKAIGSITESLEKSGEEFSSTISGMNENLEKASDGISDAISNLNETIGEAGEGVTGAFEGLNETIGKAGEGITESFSGLNDTIDKAGEGVTSSFDTLNSSVSQAGDTVSGSLADFKISVDETSEELKEAVGELHGAISQATGEMVNMAKAKLDTDATEIAGQLSLAAKSIQSFIAKKSGSSENDDNEQVA